jgi:hypothetical protein
VHVNNALSVTPHVTYTFRVMLGGKVFSRHLPEVTEKGHRKLQLGYETSDICGCDMLWSSGL